ncbi:glutamate biosynthesis-related protein [Atractiella rhizophila]|nr:glutamate biosynthesis-related protein [Atractiella rhizophila]
MAPLSLPFPAPTIGIIGGSGVYSLNLPFICTVRITTPYGSPSSDISIARIPSSPASAPRTVAFLARHGLEHAVGPSEINYRANVAALKRLGCKAIIGFSAVGSLREEIRPGDVVIPDQLIDRTKGTRPSTYFQDGIVAHATFGEPFTTPLLAYLSSKIKDAIKTFDSGSKDVRLHENKTLVVMEGPAFSTRAESNMYRAWGGDIIGMTALPEAKLAREAELGYVLVCTSTDYDSWRVTEEAVNATEVLETLHANSVMSKHISLAVIEALGLPEASEALDSSKGGMKLAIFRDPTKVKMETRKKLGYILEEYFGVADEGTFEIVDKGNIKN